MHSKYSRQETKLANSDLAKTNAQVALLNAPMKELLWRKILRSIQI